MRCLNHMAKSLVAPNDGVPVIKSLTAYASPWIDCKNWPPMPVHVEAITTAAPMQNARASPWAKKIPVSSQPETTSHNPPSAIPLAKGTTLSTPQSNAKEVMPINMLRKLKRHALRLGGSGGGSGGVSAVVIGSSTVVCSGSLALVHRSRRPENAGYATADANSSQDGQLPVLPF